MGLSLLITGAGGFVGRHAVAEAQARGHVVRALVRSGDDLWDDNVEVIHADLAADDLSAALVGVDAVIHIAAAMAGNDATHARDTVLATERLMQAVAAAPNPPRVVLLSSLAVYDFANLKAGDTVRETTPLTDGLARDAYCRAKLAQEGVAAELATGSLWILRAGAIFGMGRLWNDHIGPRFGPLLLRFGKAGQIPLSYVVHVVEALILAAEQEPEERAQILNVVDDDLPDRIRFLNALQRYKPALIAPISWRILWLLAGMLRPLAARLPGLFRREVLAARLMPLRYDNARLRATLGWQPRLNFEAAMAAAQEGAP